MIMITLPQKLGLLSPIIRQSIIIVRYARRVNVQKPRAPFYERARVLELVKPIFPEPIEKFLPPALKCLRNKEKQEDKFRIDNPYERLIAKDILNWFNHSRMIAIYHQNPITGDDMFQAKVKFKRENMHVKNYSHFTMEMALEKTIYEPILQLFKVHNIVVFSEEPHVDKLLKVSKKIPQLVLMAAIVDGRLLSVSQMIELSKIKSITEARCQLTGVLNSAAVLAVSQLSQHQSTLLNQLKHISEGLLKKERGSSSDTNET